MTMLSSYQVLLLRPVTRLRANHSGPCSTPPYQKTFPDTEQQPCDRPVHPVPLLGMFFIMTLINPCHSISLLVFSLPAPESQLGLSSLLHVQILEQCLGQSIDVSEKCPLNVEWIFAMQWLSFDFTDWSSKEAYMLVSHSNPFGEWSFTTCLKLCDMLHVWEPIPSSFISPTVPQICISAALLRSGEQHTCSKFLSWFVFLHHIYVII